ncbi:hypothetical protein Hdeb2414_s0001g00009431 [Helianthus debilis subsp. tardiflorus]
MSLRDELKVPNFNVLDFDFDEQVEGEIPFLKQVSSSAQEIRPLTEQSASEPHTADATSSAPKLVKETAGSSGSWAKDGTQTKNVDSDPEVRSLDEALKYRPSGISIKSKARRTPFWWKIVQGRGRLGSFCSNSRFSGGYLPVNETENTKVEDPVVASKGDGKTQGETKVVTFSGTILDSSLGPDCFIDDEKDQVSSLPPSWFGPELMYFLRYADVFTDDMEIDPATADEKFVPDWDIRNKHSVMNDLTARMFLFNISTPLDHARSRKMKGQDLGAAVLLNQAQSNVYVTELYRRWVEAESVKEDLEKETIALKRKVQRTPDAEKKLSQLSQDLQAQKEKVKSLTALNQSSQAAVASASEKRDKIAAELKCFAESSKEKDAEHKGLLKKMEVAVTNVQHPYYYKRVLVLKMTISCAFTYTHHI